jgi:hypothetical protein
LPVNPVVTTKRLDIEGLILDDVGTGFIVLNKGYITCDTAKTVSVTIDYTLTETGKTALPDFANTYALCDDTGGNCRKLSESPLTISAEQCLSWDHVEINPVY